MATEPDRDSTEAGATATAVEPSREGERKKKKRPKPPLPRTEDEIDAPDRLTLFMLGVMCFVTLVLWGFARGACNYHPPRETRRPRPMQLEELARDPKDAALEMQQRFVQADYDGALELAADSAADEVKKQKADCAANVKTCAEKKKKHEKNVATVAFLLERDPGSATVRVTTTLPGGKQTYLAKLERRGPLWKVVSRAPDTGQWKPKAPEPGAKSPELGMIQLPVGSAPVLPMGSGSAAPKPRVPGSAAPRVPGSAAPRASATP